MILVTTKKNKERRICVNYSELSTWTQVADEVRNAKRNTDKEIMADITQSIAGKFLGSWTGREVFKDSMEQQKSFYLNYGSKMKDHANTGFSANQQVATLKRERGCTLPYLDIQMQMVCSLENQLCKINIDLNAGKENEQISVNGCQSHSSNTKAETVRLMVRMKFQLPAKFHNIRLFWLVTILNPEKFHVNWTPPHHRIPESIREQTASESGWNHMRIGANLEMELTIAVISAKYAFDYYIKLCIRIGSFPTGRNIIMVGK